MFGQKSHDLALALLGSGTKGGLSAHFGTTGFKRKREVQDAEPLLG